MERISGRTPEIRLKLNGGFGKHCGVLLPPAPPSLQRSALFFNGIGHGLRCKSMISIEFFADVS
jgi:hypothetical protein